MTNAEKLRAALADLRADIDRVIRCLDAEKSPPPRVDMETFRVKESTFRSWNPIAVNMVPHSAARDHADGVMVSAVQDAVEQWAETRCWPTNGEFAIDVLSQYDRRYGAKVTINLEPKITVHGVTEATTKAGEQK